MPELLVVVSVAVALIAIFAAYWIGRDSGEKEGFASQQYANEQLTQSNVRLRMDVERLRRERDAYADVVQRRGYSK
jgi:cell division protein FtsB